MSDPRGMPYCDHCEKVGHTFNTCPARDDPYYEELEDEEDGD